MIINLLLIILMTVASLIALPNLPQQLPTHWNIHGVVDQTLPKYQAVWIFPLIAFALFILFRLLPILDPKKESYTHFKREWQIMQTLFICLFGYLQFISFYVSTHPQVPMPPLLFLGLGSFFIILGNYISKVRQNFFIGVRTPWTLSSEENWNKTHRFASWTFVIAGIITVAEIFFFWQASIVIFSSIILAGLLPMLYSFLLYKKREHIMKTVLALVGLCILTILLIKSASPEDSWICRGGRWVAHGKPDTAAPMTPCP